MKTFIAYTLVVIGIPVFGGLLVGAIVGIPVAWLLARSERLRQMLLPYLEVFSGLGAVLAAALLFRLFGLTPSVAVPIIMAAWVSYYFLSYRQSFQAWFSWLLGLLVGWLTLPRLFAF